MGFLWRIFSVKEICSRDSLYGFTVERGSLLPIWDTSTTTTASLNPTKVTIVFSGLTCIGKHAEGGLSVPTEQCGLQGGKYIYTVTNDYDYCVQLTDSVSDSDSLAFSFLRSTISPPPTLVARSYYHSVK